MTSKSIANNFALSLSSVVILQGESATGKSTLQNELVKTSFFEKLITDTTRPPRSGEIDGVDYNFLVSSPDHAAAYLIRSQLYGNFYGLSFKEVMRAEKFRPRIPLAVLDLSDTPLLFSTYKRIYVFHLIYRSRDELILQRADASDRLLQRAGLYRAADVQHPNIVSKMDFFADEVDTAEIANSIIQTVIGSALK
jgi:Guanylate kinase